MDSFNTIVGVYDTYQEALIALEALKKSGQPLKNISFIGRADVIEHKLSTSLTDTSNLPVEIGAVLGPLLGILAGTSIIAIPGLGFIYGAGAVVGALAGFDIGLVGGGFTTLLMTLGISKDKTEMHRDHLEKGKYIITISGDHEIAEKAKNILHTVGTHIDLQHH